MGDGEGSDCPRHRVFLDGYYLGVHCITNRQYQRFVEATGHRPSFTSYPAEYAEHPVTWVFWEDANAYCAWAGLALPTEAQWERGAGGPKNLLYPWGNDWDKGKCRHYNKRGRATTCSVFAYPQGASGFGTLNQSGNVWEWCQDWYDSEYYSNSPDRNPEGPTTGGLRVVRGGSMINPRPSAAFRTAELPGKGYISGYHHGDLGFRPCLPLNQSNGPRENDNSH